MRVWVAPYTLWPRDRPGAAGRAGALIRVETPEGALGYADLFPWPELGDAPLGAQLQVLAAGGLTPLLRRSLASARTDALARARGRSLLAGLEVPRSHYLLMEAGLLRHLSPSRLLSEGFDCVKLKVGRALSREMEELVTFAGRSKGLRLRLDTNARVGCAEVEQMLKLLRNRWGAQELSERVEFLEDPCPFDAASWRRLRERFQVGLAMDFEGAKEPCGVTHRIIKPAAEDPETVAAAPLAASQRLVVTSYLDHPVGQLHAAHAAALLRDRHKERVVTCGLLSQHAYAPTAYSEALPARGAFLDTAGLGVGIGLGELLEREQWVLP